MADKKYLDYDGLVEVVTKVRELIGETGSLVFKGTVADVAHLPVLADQEVGYMYTVTAAGTTTADFTDGAGKNVAANSEVAAVEVDSSAGTPCWSVDGGTSYISADLQAYTPVGTVGSPIKLAECYVGTASDEGLDDGALYVTADDGSSFYKVTALAETFADFTKTQEANETALATLNTLYTGSLFVDLNLYSDVVTTKIKKWCLIGPVFDVSDRLQFGDTMPSNPVDGQTFLYMGETTYTYTPVSPEGTEDPAALGWYHSTDGSTWEPATEHTPDTATYQYATREEQYVTGVIYVYDESQTKWVAQTAGDTMIAITKGEIDALFE